MSQDRPSDHFNGEIDDDSLFGAFGNEYNGKAPARRWCITKFDLLAAQAIGYKLRMVSAFVPLQITTPVMAAGVAGQTFSQTLRAEGGIPFYNWTQASGSIPDGLHLDSFSGTISGVPLKAGTFTFTIRVQEYKAAAAGVISEFAMMIASVADPCLRTEAWPGQSARIQVVDGRVTTLLAGGPGAF